MTQTILQKVVAGEPWNGNQSVFAKAIGTSQQNVSNWLRKGSVLPAEFVLAAESVTGTARHDWRPDIYPAPAASDAA